MVGWLKRLFGGGADKTRDVQMDDLYIAPSGHSDSRVDAALPGTADLPPLLVLDPPPVDPDLRFDPDDETRDYGPNPVAEFSFPIPAAQPFDNKELHSYLRSELGDRPGFMSYVTTPAGHTTYMVSGDGPGTGAIFRPAWSFWPGAGNTQDTILASIDNLRAALAKRPEAFDMPVIDPAAVHKAYAAAQQIIDIAPETVTIWVAHDDDRPMDGKEVWDTLHRLGFRWGDMDCFQWADPTHQTDYLIWVEVRDGQYDYALPEEIAAGRQHFTAVSFTVNLPRTPFAVHVTTQMIRAAEACASELGANLGATVDHDGVAGPDDLLRAAQYVTDALATLGTKPGASAVCMLR